MTLKKTLLAVGLVLLMALTACSGGTQSLKPVISIITPVEGARFGVGETIMLQVAAASSNNVVRIELRLNNAIVATAQNDDPSPTFSTQINYTPNQSGTLTLMATAIDGTGGSSEPYLLNIIIGEDELFSVPLPTQPVQPTQTPPPGVIGDNGCTLSATFVTDVTIPDNTIIDAGKSFIKTWRMRNTSTCAWESGYKLKFLSDDIMGATPEMAIPPTPKDAEVDISVQFTAPATSGTYTSTWRLLEPGGKLFGNRVFVVINVS
jgi:hypothetical protein